MPEVLCVSGETWQACPSPRGHFCGASSPSPQGCNLAATTTASLGRDCPCPPSWGSLAPSGSDQVWESTVIPQRSHVIWPGALQTAQNPEAWVEHSGRAHMWPCWRCKTLGHRDSTHPSIYS